MISIILFIGSLASFISSLALYFIVGDWFGAMGWFLVSCYQLGGALK